MFKSIRTGLFAALAGFTVFLCVCYTGLAVVISYVTEDMLIDRLLQREAETMTAQVQAGGAIRAPANALIGVHRSAGTLPPAVREQVRTGSARAEVFTETGQHYHLRTLDLPAPGGPQRIYLLADVGPLLVVTTLFRDVGALLGAVALGLLALALGLAYLLSRRLVTPLQLLAEQVRSVKPDAARGGDAAGAPGHESVAFSARGRRDEIGYLADRLGATIGALHAALAREHAFTRDVSHELRTPLTVMNNALGLAAAQTTDAMRAQLQAGVDDIGRTIDVLFALARAEHIARAPFDLRLCIEESLLRLLDEGRGSQVQLSLDLPERLSVTGNRQLATLLINNCLGNAVFHGGAACRLTLTYGDGVLGIANTIDPDRAGSTQGFLHGQNLLRRIAAAMDWELRVHGGERIYRIDVVVPRTH